MGALFAPKFAVLGVLGRTWGHLAPKTSKKGENRDLFGCFWTVLGGVLAPMWAPRGHLGCILGVLGSILGAFGEIWGAFLGHFVACAAFQKTLKKPSVFIRFLESGGWWMGYLKHLGSCFGRCWLEVELSWLVSALSCDMLAARWRPRAPR